MPPYASYSSQLDGSLRVVSALNSSKHGNGSLLVQNGAEFFGSDDQHLRTTSASADLYLGSKKNINIGSTDALQINVSRAGQNTNIKGSFTVDQVSTLNGAVTANNNLNVVGSSTLQSPVSCGSTLAVTGTATLSDALSVAQGSTLSGAVACGSTLNVTGASEFTGAVACKSSLVVDTTSQLKGDVQMDANCVIAGNLTVQGATTTVSTENVLVKDNLMVLNSASAVGKDSGLLFNRAGADASVFYFDESDNCFVLATTETTHDQAVVSAKAFSKLKCAGIESNAPISQPGFETVSVEIPGN